MKLIIITNSSDNIVLLTCDFFYFNLLTILLQSTKQHPNLSSCSITRPIIRLVMNSTLFPVCARSPRIPWLSALRRTIVSQCCFPEIVYSSLMENIFPNHRCLSQSELDPRHDYKWKGQLVQVRELLLRFLLRGGAFCGRMNKTNIEYQNSQRLDNVTFCLKGKLMKPQ